MQGEVLTPILFSFYLNELCLRVSKRFTGNVEYFVNLHIKIGLVCQYKENKNCCIQEGYYVMAK